jgi:hypothetical protein
MAEAPRSWPPRSQSVNARGRLKVRYITAAVASPAATGIDRYMTARKPKPHQLLSLAAIGLLVR